MVAVFREVKRVLREDGTLWLNLGDSYAATTKGSSGVGKNATNKGTLLADRSWQVPPGLKPKDLIGIPWRVAFALQADGWYLRQDIIWHKPNPMPESVTDRCTKAHEYIFLLSKSERYYYDQDAIKESVSGQAHRRMKTPDGWDTSSGDGGHGSFHKDGLEKGSVNNGVGWGYSDGKERKPRTKKEGPNSCMHVSRAAGAEDSKPNASRSALRAPGVTPKSAPAGSGTKANESFHAAVGDLVDRRNKRSVWTVATEPCKEAHFATFPQALITPCILAGCPVGGTVLDPFGGSCTTGQVSESCGRNSILIELNPAYIEIGKRRTAEQGLGI